MSDLIAFHGNSALKRLCIERIEKQRDSRSIGPVLREAWLPQYSMCTLIGALLEDSDTAKLEEATGIPSQLALLAQNLLGASTVSTPNQAYADSLQSAPPWYELPDSMRGQWTAWVEAIQVGGKVPDIFADVIAAILRDLMSTDHAVAPLPPDVEALLSDVLQLFEAEVRGEPVTPQQWKNARAKCVVLTDALQGSQSQSAFTKPLAVFLESLCWSWDGDYTEPLQSLRALADEITYLLSSRLASEADQEIIAGQQRAMAQFFVEAEKDPKFDPKAFFAGSKELKAFWDFDFQKLLATQKLQVVPFVGGRMMAEFVACIERRQTK